MKKDDQGRCKWCGLPMHAENPHNDYCGTTCKIAAVQEAPTTIRKRKIRYLMLGVGAFYGLFLAGIDNCLNIFFAYMSGGALVGALIGHAIGEIIHIPQNRNKNRYK